ncbi:hypothetical protein D3C87_80400 [compost metagenome]
MQKETLQVINNLLKSFNNTFEIDANLTQEDNEIIANSLKIKSLKDDGSNFINEFHETFNTLVNSLSEKHEVIYNEQYGLVIAKTVKVTKTEFIIEDEFK